MKQFVFTLQSLYDMKLSEEKQKKIELAAVEKELRSKNDELSALKREFKEKNEEYLAVMAAGTDAERIKQFGVFFTRLKESIALTEKQIDALEQEKQQIVAQLVEIRKEIKLLGKLHDEQYAEYLDKRKKMQEALIGDIVSYKVTVS